MSWRIMQGDVLKRLADLEDESVQTCVTSPPYWGLRDYGTAAWVGGDPECDHIEAEYRKGVNLAQSVHSTRGGAKKIAEVGYRQFSRACGKCGAQRIDSQLGLEPTPDEYVATMVAVFREIRRVLRDDGTLWLNLGDSYAARASGNDRRGRDALDRPLHERQPLNGPRHAPRPPGVKNKDLVGIPWMVAFALRSDGWWLRSDIIWAKPNPMPESVTDRPTRAHEYLFLLTKSARYFYDADAIREDALWPEGVHSPGKSPHSQGFANGSTGAAPNGRNKRSVWTVTTQPYPDAVIPDPPQATDAEQALLGALMTSRGILRAVLVQSGLRREHFGSEKHRAIFAACQRIAARGEDVDAITVWAQLERDDDVPAGITRSELSNLASNVPAPGNAPQYAGLVIEAAVLRAKREAALTILEGVGEHDDRLILRGIEAASADVTDAPARPSRTSSAMRCSTTCASPGPRKSSSCRGARSTASSVPAGCCAASSACSPAGRTSASRSRSISSWADSRPRATGRGCSAPKCPGSSACVAGWRRRPGIEYRRLIRREKLTEDEFADVETAAGAMPFGFRECAGWPATRICQEIAARRVDVAAIDPLNLIPFKDTREYDDILRQLKETAVRAGCLLICVSQLNMARFRDENPRRRRCATSATPATRNTSRRTSSPCIAPTARASPPRAASSVSSRCETESPAAARSSSSRRLSASWSLLSRSLSPAR
jgi:DNA modification methylase